jgi:hypothetical protein
MIAFDRVDAGELARILRVPQLALLLPAVQAALDARGLLVEHQPDGSPQWDRADVVEETAAGDRRTWLRHVVRRAAGWPRC